MPTIIRRNERSWAISMISDINIRLQTLGLRIVRAGGETIDTDERVRKNGKAVSNALSGKKRKPLTEEHKKAISMTCLNKSKNGEGHKSIAKYHHYTYKDTDLDCQWELRYAIWLDEHNIKWERPKTRFPYTYDGEVHYYTPDFYLVDTNEYIEIKGYKTNIDTAKWEQFPYDTDNLIVLEEQQLKLLGIKTD